jgi:hypothetical protein
MPSKGSETCLVVEQLFSLNLVHEVQGDAYFAERAETIAYNALPSIGTKDLWARVYLQQPNEIFAGHSDPHVWNTDGDVGINLVESGQLQVIEAERIVNGFVRTRRFLHYR